MSELGSLTFVPYLRRGIATQIDRPDGGGTPGARARIPVRVGFNSNTLVAEAPLALKGPGEVVGLDPRAVIRTWPTADMIDAEANLFPFVELDQADLPWRYSPAAPDVHGRLRPWLALIVLANGELAAYESADRARSLATLSVSAELLPTLGQSWAWAHVQASGIEGADPAEIPDLLRDSPHRWIARLISPRRMVPNRSYRAFVVPTFERGRLAGLGLPVGDAVDAQQPAWTAAGDGAVTLPIYYQWRFTTAATGDFEYWVSQLVPRPLPPSVGLRALDVNHAGRGIPASASAPVDLEGALRAPGTVPRDWPVEERQPWIDQLTRLVNAPTDLLESSTADPPALSPPLYGRWHAATTRLEPDEPPPWFQELNADPRHRVAAALGTEVIQDQQRQLMASAWKQVDGILSLNERLRYAQLGREVAERMFLRHLAGDDPETVLHLTRPLHARVRASPMTIEAALRTSPIPRGVLSGAWRRVARTRGPLGRRQGQAEGPRSSTLLARANRAEIAAASLPPVPSEMATPARAGGTLLPAWATPAAIAAIGRAPTWLLGIAAAALAGTVLVFVLIGATLALATGLVAVGVLAARPWLRRLANDLAAREAIRSGALASSHVDAVPPRPSFVATESPPGLVAGTAASSSAAPAPSAHSSGDSSSARAFRAAASTLASRLASRPAPGAALRRLELGTLGSKLLARLDPRETIPARIHRGIDLPAGFRWQTIDPIEPIMAAPSFTQPMYEPLAAISQDWILSGLDRVPANTATLAVTNQRFVEAYMLGLNHEMARELTWNEYPTDQRGTYFRRFWDTAGVIAQGSSTDDVRPIHEWPRDAWLGGNSAREQPPSGEQLVLVIRGEVMRRYPNTIVYAVRAVLDESGRRGLGTQQLQPIFHGRLQPDVAFFGFDVTTDQVRGDETDPGWYFVLQEQPSEPRFGLDVGAAAGTAPAEWNHLSWEHLATDAGELDALIYVDFDSALPDTSAIADPQGAIWGHTGSSGTRRATAADLAFITMQQPVRVAIHATALLPSDATT